VSNAIGALEDNFINIEVREKEREYGALAPTFLLWPFLD
jgi:hypothetical protein